MEDLSCRVTLEPVITVKKQKKIYQSVLSHRHGIPEAKEPLAVPSSTPATTPAATTSSRPGPSKGMVNPDQAKPGEIVGNYYCHLRGKPWMMLGVDRHDRTQPRLVCKDQNGCKSVGKLCETYPPRATEMHWANVAFALAEDDDMNLADAVKEEVVLQQEPPGGLAPQKGIDYLIIPRAAKLDAWKHGTIFPNHKTCLWYPREKCANWTGVAQSSAACAYTRCTSPNCTAAFSMMVPAEDLIVKAERQRLRLALLQTMTP